MTHYLLLQTAIADYRQAVMSILAARLGPGFQALAGEEYFDPSTKTTVQLGSQLQRIDNAFVLGRRLLWQSGVILRAIGADAVMLEFNPRILSNWIICIGRRLLGRRTVFWGHAWGRQGPHTRSAWLRRLFRRLSNVLVVYTEQQMHEVIAEGKYRGQVIAAPNALYTRSAMRAVDNSRARSSFIYVGRLVESKHPARLLEAFIEFCAINEEATLGFVGRGPLAQSLMARITQAGLADRVRLTGHVADPLQLHALYSKSLFSVSPGYVGLSVTQSLGFGVPMIISRHEPHAPEIEAAVEGENCLFFDAGKPGDLVRVMHEAWAARARWACRAAEISDTCADRYSAELMAARLEQAFQAGLRPGAGRNPERVL